jgi:hypothetical protein
MIEYKADKRQALQDVILAVVDLVEAEGEAVRFEVDGRPLVAVPVDLWEQLWDTRDCVRIDLYKLSEDEDDADSNTTT